MKIKKQSLTEMLPYWELVDGIMFLEDGTYEIGVSAQVPPTLFYNTNELYDFLLQYKSLLRNAVPEGSRLRMYVISEPSRDPRISDYVDRVDSRNPLARELVIRRANLMHQAEQTGILFQWKVFFTLRLGKPSRKKRSSLSPAELELILKSARTARQRLANFMAAANLHPQIMGTDEVFGATFRFLNPDIPFQDGQIQYLPTWQKYPKKAIEKSGHLAPPTLRSQLAKSEVENSFLHEMGLGGRRVRIVELGSTPDETQFGMIQNLINIGGRLALVLDFTHEPFGAAIRNLKGRARKYYSAANAEDIGYKDANVRVGLEETDQAIEFISQTGDHVYRCSAALVLIDDTTLSLESRTQLAYSYSAQIPGNPFFPLNQGLWTTFQTLLPFCGRDNDLSVSLIETNAAHFFPSNAPWYGNPRPVMLFENRWGGLTSVDPFDPKNPNWNAIIVGSSGSGKTFFTQYALTELLAQENVDVVIVDRGLGYSRLVEAMNGATIVIEPGGGTSINPFDLDPGEIVPDENTKSFLFSLIRAMIPSDRKGREEAEEDALIVSAIEQTYARLRSEKRVDGEYKVVSEVPKLTDFVRTLYTMGEVGDRNTTEREREIGKGLALRLQIWTGNTPLGRFVDRDTSYMPDARVVYYETSGLANHPELETVATLLISNLVWKKVKKNPSRKKVVVFDEAWALLKVPAAANFMVELYRRFRKYGAAAWSVTQSLSDFTTDAAAGILQNTTYHYMLKLNQEHDLVQQLLGLTDNAKSSLETLTRISGSYSEVLTWIRQENGNIGDIIRIVPTKLDYWTFTTTADDQPKIAKAIEYNRGDIVQALLDLAQ